MIIYIGVFLAGAGFTLITIAVIALCRSAKEADMCRLPPPSSSAALEQPLKNTSQTLT